MWPEDRKASATDSKRMSEDKYFHVDSDVRLCE